ncbi:hypothetical protein SYNPS1DRAFT_30189 [Syncephalis pseudoplumigaleata]|uniref:Uncharacterized protein n=1 Tax=Syncephalis pseudoplumigaleata TaxID=1712513 RepID=A0A4P9YVW2_9FUNG|nr:hypothetical protein SYNPS1DRAFT_30189 [Syncephalis pseudoplumigaleata]|eukprot:RKP24044.1 hypothetical protein SYNPS1DRAFT_30189 [Syncephalis pseudoplumigaleata]
MASSTTNSQDIRPTKEDAAPLDEALGSTSDFPPLPTQKDASPPSPPPPPSNGESYAQAAKHNIASESEDAAPGQPRKRSRSQPYAEPEEPEDDDAISTARATTAAKTWFGVGVVAAVIGRVLLNRNGHHSGSRSLMVGGAITAFLSGLSWVWLRRSATSRAK